MKLIELVADIQKLRKRANPPIVVVGNKNDLEQGNTLGIHDSEQAVLGSFPHFNVSAVENDGLQEAFKCLVQMSSQQHLLSSWLRCNDMKGRRVMTCDNTKALNSVSFLGFSSN